MSLLTTIGKVPSPFSNNEADTLSLVTKLDAFVVSTQDYESQPGECVTLRDPRHMTMDRVSLRVRTVAIGGIATNS